MPTQPYKNAKGLRVSGVTTILGNNCGWNKNVLARWANRIGLEGIDMRSYVANAAEIGNIAHSMVEEHIQGRDPETAIQPNMLEHIERGGRRAFAAYLAWERRSQAILVGTELYGVDEETQTGWCLDAIALFKNENDELVLELLDWKSSNGTYPEHFMQVCAYVVFFERLTGLQLHGVHLCRFGKTDGEFAHHYWPRELVDIGYAAFMDFRNAENKRRKIEQLCR